MNCHEAQQLIHGYVDGELDLTKNLEIDQHLRECTACAQVYTELQAVRIAIKDGAPYFEMPSGLQRRVRTSLRQASKATPWGLVLPLRWLVSAAAVVVLVLTGWGLVRFLSSRSPEPPFTQQLLASHIRSLMIPGHRVDIESSNQHVVKPWFEGKLDFSPPVKDFTDQEFPLVGGRLDYVDNRPVAALVYRRRDHLINLFVWPATFGSAVASETRTRQGYHVIQWMRSGMNYCAISNLNTIELQDFVRLVQANAP